MLSRLATLSHRLVARSHGRSVFQAAATFRPFATTEQDTKPKPRQFTTIKSTYA